MKYIDFSSLFDGDPAFIAFFSTYQFDPDFFERRLLRCETLKKARRIAVFMDARQWQVLLNHDVHTRLLNRRYLVVPVNRSQGVFHPKLNLVITDNGGQIQCGSNNLTRSGCSSNLELINSIPFEFNDNFSNEMQIAKETLKFFKRAAQDADNEVKRIASSWIQETEQTHTWLRDIGEESQNYPVQLVHTYNGTLWSQIDEAVKNDSPKKFFVISPFHDSRGEICKRLAKQWPKAKVELLVQQGYTNLSVSPLRKLKSFRLSEIVNTTGKDASRRVHAKLFSWRSKNVGGCMVGSANFTSAAFDGRNVEACLLIHESSERIDQLFNKELTKRSLALDDFEPGSEDPPEAKSEEIKELQIVSAVLVDSTHIRISYVNAIDKGVNKLRLTVRIAGEAHPRRTVELPIIKSSTTTVVLPGDTFTDCHGVVLASLIADLSDGQKRESLPVWIVQEEHLTYEPGEGSSASKSRIEETGEGLYEYIDDLGEREGVRAIVEYLSHLNIRFNDGSRGMGSKRKFCIRISDPFQKDMAPPWLLDAESETVELKQAIYDFIDRHISKKLCKHAKRGNINGMENFLDIFTTLVSVLYRWYKRDVVKGVWLIGSITTMLNVATCGKDTERESFDGFLFSLRDSLEGDAELLQEVSNETNYCGEMYAALLIAQMVRFRPGEILFGKEIKRPKETLQDQSRITKESISECKLKQPTIDEVRNALEKYRMFSEDEIDSLLGEL